MVSLQFTIRSFASVSTKIKTCSQVVVNLVCHVFRFTEITKRFLVRSSAFIPEHEICSHQISFIEITKVMVFTVKDTEKLEL